MLRICGRISSINVRKVLWLAAEAGLAHEREDWGKPVRDPNVPAFLKLNPNAQVPVIIDDGFVLWESHAILRYLADTAGSDTWPAAPTERALVDQWMSWQSTELNPAWSYAVAAILRNTPPQPDPERLQASIVQWTARMGIIERHLGEGRAFVANDRFSLADIVMGLSFHRFFSVFPEAEGLDACRDHLTRMRKRPAGEPWLGASTP